MGCSKDRITNELANDLKMVVEELHDLLLIFGVGAKISSGFGVMSDQVQYGRLKIPSLKIDVNFNSISQMKSKIIGN